MTCNSNLEFEIPSMSCVQAATPTPESSPTPAPSSVSDSTPAPTPVPAPPQDFDNIVQKTFGDATCSGDVTGEITLTMDDMLSLTATAMGAQDVVLGACVDASGDGYLASLKPVCKTSLTGTFLATEMYTGTDACDEALLSSGSSLSGE